MPLPTVETRQMDAFATLALHIQKSPYTDDLALPRPKLSNRDCVRAQMNASFPHERRQLKVLLPCMEARWKHIGRILCVPTSNDVCDLAVYRPPQTLQDRLIHGSARHVHLQEGRVANIDLTAIFRVRGRDLKTDQLPDSWVGPPNSSDGMQHMQ
jgi:hypothetical protein